MSEEMKAKVEAFGRFRQSGKSVPKSGGCPVDADDVCWAGGDEGLASISYLGKNGLETLEARFDGLLGKVKFTKILETKVSDLASAGMAGREYKLLRDEKDYRLKEPDIPPCPTIIPPDDHLTSRDFQRGKGWLDCENALKKRVLSQQDIVAQLEVMEMTPYRQGWADYLKKHKIYHG